MRFWALRNLFFSTNSGSRSPAGLVLKTRTTSPWALVSNLATFTLPLKRVSSTPRTKMTASSPPSCKRKTGQRRRRVVDDCVMQRSGKLTNGTKGNNSFGEQLAIDKPENVSDG